jgi:hypothetical protein
MYQNWLLKNTIGAAAVIYIFGRAKNHGPCLALKSACLAKSWPNTVPNIPVSKKLDWTKLHSLGNLVKCIHYNLLCMVDVSEKLDQ